MEKDAIVSLLEDSHNKLYQWLETHAPEKWTLGPKGKWTTGQHTLHLLQSIKLLNKAMATPKVLLKYKFGKANRPVRDYNTIISRYISRLANFNCTPTFRSSLKMKIPSIREKNGLLDSILVENKKLQAKTKKWSDKQLDNYILPHPLMGKMPVREIIMWTAYHTDQHLNTLKKNY